MAVNLQEDRTEHAFVQTFFYYFYLVFAAGVLPHSLYTRVKYPAIFIGYTNVHLRTCFKLCRCTYNIITQVSWHEKAKEIGKCASITDVILAHKAHVRVLERFREPVHVRSCRSQHSKLRSRDRHVAVLLFFFSFSTPCQKPLLVIAKASLEPCCAHAATKFRVCILCEARSRKVRTREPVVERRDSTATFDREEDRSQRKRKR